MVPVERCLGRVLTTTVSVAADLWTSLSTSATGRVGCKAREAAGQRVAGSAVNGLQAGCDAITRNVTFPYKRDGEVCHGPDCRMLRRLRHACPAADVTGSSSRLVIDVVVDDENGHDSNPRLGTLMRRRRMERLRVTQIPSRP